MEKRDSGTYRSILKGTAIFGGVQVINILVGLVRGKLVAMFLGASGMGIGSLFTTSCATIQQFASLGLNMASVRDISAANECGDARKAAETVKAMKWAIRSSAIIGALFTSLAAPWLSEITFGSSEYVWSFRCLSCFVFFSLMSGGENAVLQGFRRLKSLASLSVAGAFCGLLVGVPLYYWRGIDGIVPAMIISSLVSFGFAKYGTNKITLPAVTQSWRRNISVCRSMLAIGVLMTIGVCLGMLANYTTLGFVRSLGSLKDVGFYNAANSITMQYCAMVFSAMATDYYPRLSAIAHDKEASMKLVNQQTELVVLLIAPIVCVAMLVAPVIIRVLLTKEFLPVIDLVRFMAYGLLFKAFCFPMGYLALSKGDKLYYFCTDGIWTNIKTPLIFISCYSMFGLIGLGYASVLNSIVDVIVVQILTKWRYGITLGNEFYRLVLPLLIFLSICFAASFLSHPVLSYSLMLVCSVCILAYTWRELEKRMAIKEIISNKLSGWKKKR